MNQIVKALLNAMDKIEQDHEEVTDTETRGYTRRAIMDGFVYDKPDFVLADSFAMADEEGDAKVKKALAKFLTKARAHAKKAGLSTPEARLRAFQVDVQSDGGSQYDVYFNHVDHV